MEMIDIYGQRRSRGSEGTPVLTHADWLAGRKPTGRAYGYRWVEPNRENRTKEEWPYSYSDHFILGKPAKGDHAVYSDRLAQYDREKWERAWNLVKTSGGFRDMTQRSADEFITAYEGKPCKVSAIAEGCNVSSGYPYWIVWYSEATDGA